ncbi:uncharacterized protein LOC109834154 isoform X2 [Asparagus officinalis]|uniref:uncharacterized protein LOC109834154 isoform X2 n=1 Tax=Asparagus officinalis TaxID=4686 RepID=UPI00098E42C4|nr:uncharacterized protein LOC109834154 isoform X2 [Asparagus officinalis]
MELKKVFAFGLLFELISLATGLDRSDFPSSFLFGTATSCYQKIKLIISLRAGFVHRIFFDKNELEVFYPRCIVKVAKVAQNTYGCDYMYEKLLSTDLFTTE